MASDLDALEDALATSTGKFRPKANKFQAKKPFKSSSTVDHINRPQNEPSLVSQNTSGGPSRVDATDHGVLSNVVSDLDALDAAVTTVTGHVTSKFMPRKGPLESSSPVELINVQNNSQFCSVFDTNMQAATSHVDRITTDTLTNSSPDVIDVSVNAAASVEKHLLTVDAATGVENSPLTIYSKGITLEVDASVDPNTSLDQVENVSANPDTGSCQVENTEANPPTYYSQNMCSDDGMDNVLATSLPSGHVTRRIKPKNNGAANRKMVTPQSAGVDSTAQKSSDQVHNHKEKSSVTSCSMISDLDILDDGHADSASLGQKMSKFHPKVSKLRAKRNVATPSVDRIVNSDDPQVHGDTFISEKLLHDGETKRQATALQEDEQVADILGSLQGPPFVSSPFHRGSFDHGVEGEPCDPPEVGLFSMTNECTQNVVEDDGILNSALEGESGKYTRLSRRLRSHKKVINEIDATHDGSNVEFNMHEASEKLDMDDNDGGDKDFSEKSSMKQKQMAKGKKRARESQSTKRKVLKNDAPESGKKEPKKKLSHSTRRTRSLTDESLLETPEDEIDPRRLVLKDLILLADIKERRLNKAGTASRNASATVERDGVGVEKEGDLHGTFERSTQGTFERSTQGPTEDGDKTNEADEPEEIKLNYHSFMTRTPSERWSQADTELFYKAIRQFGTDFEMIQKLFPGRTRRQVKLKYKKEERKHPLELADALVNRSRDHTHFQQVIEQLQSEAQAEPSCKTGNSPEIDQQNEEEDEQFGDYNNMDTHEAGDDEWSHRTSGTTSFDYEAKDDYNEYDM